VSARRAAAVPVWDGAVRVLHWTLTASVALGWISTLWLFDAHQPAGWVALAAVLLRLAWGLVGGRHARFARFVRAPGATLAYTRAVLARREPRYLGHNPLGAWMVIALLGCVAGLALTGWLYTTDRFWGDETVEEIHLALAWGLLGLIAVHVGGVIFTGRRHRENLVRAMLDGRKRPPESNDID
jgi:cytochrome b